MLRRGVGVFDVKVNLSDYFADAITIRGGTLAGNLGIITPTTIYPNQNCRRAALALTSRLDGRTSSSFVETDFDRNYI